MENLRSLVYWGTSLLWFAFLAICIGLIFGVAMFFSTKLPMGEAQAVVNSALWFIAVSAASFTFLVIKYTGLVGFVRSLFGPGDWNLRQKTVVLWGLFALIVIVLFVAATFAPGRHR